MKGRIIGINNGWTTITVTIIMISCLVVTGCAAIRLGTLSTPPSSGKLRVFVDVITGEKNKGLWYVSHENYEKKTYSIVSDFFTEQKGYEVIPPEEVHLITGGNTLKAWQWRKDDWSLVLEVGRRLYAEYALIVERSDSPRYQRFLIINVNTNKRYEVMADLTSAMLGEWKENYKSSITKLFNDANEDIVATAIRKSRSVSSELLAARREIQELTATQKDEIAPERQMKEKETVSQPKTSGIAIKNDEKVAALEAQMAQLMESLKQLEEIKKQFDDQREKTDTLARELAQKEQREKMLLSKIENSSKVPPVIVVTSPRDDATVEVNFIQLSGVVEDEKGLMQLELYINGKRFTKGSNRGIRVVADAIAKRMEFAERVPLEKGSNQLTIRSVNLDNLITEKTISVRYIERLKNIWAVIIGIDRYPHVRQLKYAANDANLFYDYLVMRNQIPAKNVVLLLNQDATLTNIKSALGTDLKNMASRDDMVLIYFAGHGVTERDAQSPDGDGLEKYLLPFDADLNDLYATALPMGELSRIFNRIRSERLIFIADACYSGASGGRTVGMDGMRASISENFVDRIAGGKGRVVITASGANEVSAEKDELQHGVFTYFLVEGLKGSADSDGDEVVTVDEIYDYVSKHVPAATAQEQHPVKKGTVQGRLILSIVQ